MPKMEMIDKSEAMAEWLLNSPRGAHLRTYVGYLDSIDETHAGRLELEDGDSAYKLRKGLTTAAAMRGVDITIKHNAGGPMYFWLGKEALKSQQSK